MGVAGLGHPLRWFLSAVLICLLSSSAGAGKRRVFAENSLLIPFEYKDPFVWDDVVLRGTVLRVESETIPASDWFPPAILKYDSGNPVDILKTVVRVEEMLRGCTNDSLIVTRNHDTGDEEETGEWISRISGQDAIITLRYKLSPKPDLVMFGAYIRAGEGWIESSGTDPDTLTEADIRRRTSMVSVSQMTALSDLVIRGTILSRRDIGVPGNSFPEYVIRSMDLLKGSPVDSVIVRAPVDLKDGAQWRNQIAFELDEGTSWYLFLRHHVDGTFRPTAGWRSAFKVQGNELLERLNVPSCYSAATLESEIRTAAGRQ